MNRSIPIFLAFGMAIGFLPARADLTLSLSPAVQNSANGVQVVFTGTLTNTSATTQVFLNDLQITSGARCRSPSSRIPSSPNVPGILLPGESYTGPLFSVAANSGAADYPGTMTVYGGGDIQASGSLASISFAVLSPAVNLVASTPAASEYGPVSGAFTLSRTGRTDVSLDVGSTITGTAVNGVAYTIISSTTTIPAGAASAIVTIAPIPDNLAQGDRTVTLALKAIPAGAPAFNFGANTSATVTIHDKPADQWRFQEFGAAANDPQAADDGDWDGDGIPNLLEYALGLDPKLPNASALPAALPSSGYLTLSYTPNPAAIDVAYVVEASTDLSHWSTTNVEQVSNPLMPNAVTVRYTVPISGTATGLSAAAHHPAGRALISAVTCQAAHSISASGRTSRLSRPGRASCAPSLAGTSPVPEARAPSCCGRP